MATSSKGSVWRKWDLHVHSPLSGLANEYPHLPDGSPDWNQYINCLEQIRDVAVLGITDYFTLEGYKKVLEFRQNGRLQNFDLILPNIEFRLDNVLSSRTDSEPKRLNFHVIFSDTNSISPEEIEDQFLHELDFTYQGSPQGPDDQRKLKISSLIQLGKTLRSQQPSFRNRSDFEIGCTNATVSHRQITKILTEKKIFKGKYLLAFPEYLFDLIDWDGQDHQTRKVVLQKSDFIFSANPNTRKWALGQLDLSPKQFCEEFMSLKSCLHGSDAHCLNKICKPDENRFCWIKADPTFEGLKQVVYEAEDRVCIQEDKPDEKKSYSVIDKVRFSDNTGKNLFPGEYIELNPNLNTIIGGRSTGKSILLFHIAKSIDPEEVSTRAETLNSTLGYGLLEDNPNFDFEIVWKDGAKNSLKGKSDNKRRILYIPQNYLNKLSESQLPTRKAINSFVLNIVLQDQGIKTAYQESRQIISKLLAMTVTLINGLFTHEVNIETAEQEIKKLGDDKGIISFVGELKKQVETLKKESGLTDKEMEKIQKLSGIRTVLASQLAKLQHDQQTACEFIDALASKMKDTVPPKDDYLGKIENNNIRKILESIVNEIDKLQVQVSISTKLVKEAAAEKKTTLESKLIAVDSKLEPLLKRIKLQEKLKQLTDNIKIEEEKLGKINSFKEMLNDLKSKRERTINNILVTHRQIFDAYKKLQGELKKGESQLEDINLNIEISCKEEQLNYGLVDEFLNKLDLKHELDLKTEEEFVYKFDQTKYLGEIETIFKGLLNKTINTIKGRSIKDATLKLFEDYLDINFFITYKGDPLDMMSPGKKGLVLLKLLIYLSKEEYPILLDQPEGDLDNRSVYVDLVRFIKEKKKQRQIIIATHNPNLVVGADSEEIIVANQKGQDTNKENKKFQFEYVSGALENTFRLDPAVEPCTLYQKGIREHICEILEGGEEAFQKREQKYNFPRVLPMMEEGIL